MQTYILFIQKLTERDRKRERESPLATLEILNIYFAVESEVF